MPKDLRGFIKRLDDAGELVRIGETLSPRYEIPAAIDYVARHTGKALLFEKVKGYKTPIVANLLGNRRRLALALGVKEERIIQTYATRRQKPIPPQIVASAPVQQVVIDRDIDICGAIPVLTHHEKDAGPYFTCATTLARDPETGIRGMGLHRIQVKDKDTIGLLLATPPLSDFLAKAEKRGKPLEIAIFGGAGPLTFFASCLHAPKGIDKLDVAGGLAGASLKVVKCRSVNLEVPANAEFVLEGYLIPHRREKEGPFGESTGYYLTYNNPVAKIQVITHRRRPLYHALMPFGPEEDVLMSLPTGVDTLPKIRNVLPQVRDIAFRSLEEIAIVQIEKRTEEDVRKVWEYLFATPVTKIVIVVDQDVDIENPDELNWALATRVRPDRDIAIRPNLPGMTIDPSVTGLELSPELSYQMGRTAKMCIDATKPLKELERFEKVDLPPKVKSRISRMMQRLSLG